MKVLVDIPKELLEKLYGENDHGYFSIDITLGITHNHTSASETRGYGVKEIWTNDGGYKNLRFVTMDD